MKKISTLVLVLMLACFGIFVTACGESGEQDILLSQSKVVIYLGETESNTAVITATPQNVNVDKLSLFYDNTNIMVSSSDKKSDGSFDLSIIANGERGCEDVEVTVRAGANVQKTFLVTVVVPVQDIVATSDISIPFEGEEVRYNLRNILKFEPETTKQTNVSFSILTESLDGLAAIDGDYLILSPEYNLFDSDLRLVVQSLDKSEIRKEFSVKVVPNTRYFASEIEMFQLVGGAEVPLSAEGYTLNIEDGMFSEPFEILIRIPTSLGIDVDVNSLINEQTNICGFVSYTKVSEVVNSYLEVIFEFESLNLKTGVGNLYFTFAYTNASAKDLSSTFVITEDKILDGLPIEILVPTKGIKITTDCEVDASGAYIIFENYNADTAKGTQFVISTIPNNATEREFVIENITNVDVYIWLQESSSYKKLADGDIITSGISIYVCGGIEGPASLLIKKKVEDGQVSPISETMQFIVQSGASGLGFVNSETDTKGVAKKEIAVECGDEQGTSVILYAPGAKLSDLNYDAGLLISLKTTNYYEVKVVSNEVGIKNYVISTANGFEVSLTVETIQTITNANVLLESNIQDLAGVGKIKIEDGSLASISIQYGYSLALKYEVDANAEIAAINYYFGDALLGTAPYVNAYSEDYINFSKDVILEYAKYSSVVSTQNIKEADLLTALNEGKVIIKIEIVGFVVEQGQIKASTTPIEKYLCVESYRPVAGFASTAKTIELRAKNQLAEADYDEAVAEIDLSVIASGNKKATYSNIFIDGGSFVDETTIEYVYENQNLQGKMKYVASLNIETSKLTIVVDSIPSGYGYGVQNIVIFASDFYLGQDCNLSSVRQDYQPIAYTISLNIIESNSISDINVTSLKLEKQETTLEMIGGSEVEVTTKTYERVYLDISKTSATTNLYRLVTEVLPIDAFNKELKFTFVPDLNYSVALVDVSSNDGNVYYSDSEGGTGYIYIVPADPNNNSIKAIVPITVADGNSKATAFKVTNLAEIKNPNKHYIITTLSTLELNSPLFDGSAFKGGLYGRMDGSTQNATIKLNGCSLFDIISNNAVVQDITLYGDATATGFVANENKGSIKNIVVTTYISDGIYVPSLLTAEDGATIVGGLVGKNSGTIELCEFAGSIKKNKTVVSIDGIAGENSGTITDSIITVAKFEYVTQTLGRVVLNGEDYLNGVVPADGSLSGTTFSGSLVETGNVLDGDEYIKEIAFVDAYKALGNKDIKYGIVFYFGAEDSSKQEQLKEYNIIKITDLIYSSCPNLKVLALNTDGTNCSFVSVSGQNITISGVGEFVLKIYSAHDYTKFETINMLSLYYFSEFGIYEDGMKFEDGDSFTILKGGREVVYSQTTAIVDGIEIRKNNLSINFIVGGEDGSKYITGSTLGYHTINATWNGDTALLKISISAGKGTAFDGLLNDIFCMGADYDITLAMRLGTTKIETSASEGSIEPKDSISFNAIISTDIVSADGMTTEDKVLKETITIINSDGVDHTNKFNIEVGSAQKVENSDGKFSFTISASLKEDYRHEKDFVDKKYTIKIQAKNGATTYDAYATFKLTILPQSLSDVSISLYNFKSQSESGSSISNLATPTSVLKPTDSGLLMLNMFPSYATFDYIEIVATSNTLARLAFRVQKQIAPNKYAFDETAKYEALTNVNGIRIQNIFTGKDFSEYIGSYYIMIFATNTLNQDAIFNVEANVYYKGQKLDVSATFTLYVRMPASPEVSIDGKTSVYAYPGESLSANVVFPEDQTLTACEIYDVNNQLVDINVYTTHLTTTGGYNQYRLDFTIPSTLVIDISNVHLRLVVSSVKIDRGEHVAVKSELQIYLVDFKIEDNSILVKDSNDGIFNISSIKYSELELILNLSAYYNEEGKNEAVEKFRQQYYYENENGFNVGSNLEDLFKTEILATYLYYVNGNQQSPVAMVDKDGSVQLAPNSWYKNIITFNLKDAIYDKDGNVIADSKLQVKGGESIGEVPMMLQIYYSMPDGATYVYQYNFTFVNSLYTTEDMPIEITDGNSLLEISQEETAYDYILAKDIYLYDFETINETTKIKSLDGNNYTIHIVSFKAPEQTVANFALFNTVSSETTIKNLTVNYYYLNEISLADEISEVKMAGLAITNNGIIANCEVMTFAGKEKSPTFTTYGLKLLTSDASVANVNVAGFVLNNTGSITNSRVGGTEKVSTIFDYSEEGNPTLIEGNIPASMFTIRAQGTITGFCYSNTGVIASSFAKNIDIINTYNKNETKITAGFVNSNEGTITMSYVEGGKQTGEIQSSLGGIEATGIMAGFAYSNIAKISDCYSNIMIHTPSNQVGRLGAGFVYYNAPTGEITACYSFSSISGNNTTQLNFAGITDLMEYNNLGTIKNCYYYVTDEMESISIESMFNTDINTVKQVNDPLNFYGFSFSSLYAENLDATWTSTSEGPTLTSANDIAHSVRYKVDNPNGGGSSLEYIYVYSDKYDLGTANNPIIIRNAQEFNGVFGGYKNKSTEIEENFNLSTKKVFGSYRLVNNIDLTELIIDDKEESDYKYNLASTQMTLTGENKTLSNRAGAFNGNGLTISNLAISNSETAGSSNYGMFKTIENGASFSNVNIVLAKGGVKADNTVNVGTVAGTLADSSLVNVRITTNNEEEHTDIVGSNLVGGAVGRVIKNSYVFGISVTNISVVATHYQDENLTGLDLKNNTYARDESNIKSLSIAGGAFGVVDIYTQSQLLQNANRLEDDISFANVQNITTTGGMTISGMTVGGVIGYTGKYVVAKDIALVVTNNSVTPAKLIAYNCFAGGIVGYNMGFLYQIRAEHEKTWQTALESKIGTYYTSVDKETRDAVDTGNKSLFQTNEGDVTYKPVAIGGLVGVMENGIISVGYSKVNVRNAYAKYAGGAVGLINRNASASLNAAETEYVAQLLQVYTTGDVYAGGQNRAAGSGIKSYTGGVIGLNRKASLVLEKVNALNMWSAETLEELSDVASYRLNQITQISDEGTGVTREDLSVFTYDSNVSDSNYIYSVTFQTGENYSIVPMRNGDNELVLPVSGDYTTITPYYNYKGVEVDNGAQIDVSFINNGWYDTQNWARDNNEVYPHIKFTVPTSIYDIWSKKDFWKFSAYGSNPQAIFVVRTEGLIDCDKHQTTYSQLRGTIRGMYDSSGFANLDVPLFKTASNATIMNLNFDSCSAPIVESAVGITKFSHLYYSNCDFNNEQTKQVEGGVIKVDNYAGVAYEVKPFEVTFNVITFSNCTLGIKSVASNIADQNNINAGFLFAQSVSTTNTDAKINISGVQVQNQNPAVNNKTLVKDSNLGLLFGKSEVKIVLQNVSVDNKIGVLVKTIEGDDTSTQYNINVGLVGGFVNNEITIKEVTTEVAATIDVKGASGNPTNNNQIVSVGGLIGTAKTINLSNVVIEEDAGIEVQTEYSSGALNVSGEQITTYAGGLVGRVNGDLKYTLQKKNVIVGANSASVTDMIVKSTKNTYVGGIAGFANLITGTNNTSHLVYNGNIVIEQVNVADANMYTGGIVGQLASADTSVIDSVIYGGTINFATTGGVASTNVTHYVGGLIGSIENDHMAQITNTFSVGDISITSKKGNLVSKEECYIGGLIGETKTSGRATLNNVVSLTTIYNLNEMNGDGSSKVNVLIDAIATETTDGSIRTMGTGAVYASGINLCVSTISGVNNTTYTKAINSSLTGVACVTASAKQVYVNENASKLNPIVFANTVVTSELAKDFEVTEKVDDGISNITFTSKNNYKKIYIRVLDEIEDLAYRINLENAFVFGDGGVLYSKMTPFGTIDRYSAVSGIIAKVDITDANKTKSFAGFANTNNGIIYTSSAQETLIHFQDISDPSIRTKFYGYLNVNAGKATVGGFVGVNAGYIFGSNSNMHINVMSSNAQVSGFAGSNAGVIDYCYAGGYTTMTESGSYIILDLFSVYSLSGYPVTTNCYTTFADLTESDSITVAVADTVAYEQDSVENADVAGGDNTNIYGNLSWLTDNKYYACELRSNSNYPTISAGAFAGDDFKYLRRSTEVYLNTNIVKNSGLVETRIYFSDEKVSGAPIYNVSPNITTFKNVISGNNFVLARDLNLGYTGENITEALIANFTNGTLNGYDCIVKNGVFENTNAIAIIGSGATFTRFYLKDISLTGSSTGFIGTNNGQIIQADIMGTVAISITAEGSVGVLVGTNNGTIDDVMSTASVDIYGSTKSYNFGTIAGLNNKTIKNAEIVTSSIYALESAEIDIAVGGIVGVAGASSITTASGFTESNMYIASANATYVGGVVGKVTGTGASIDNCYTDSYTTGSLSSIIGGIEDSSVFALEQITSKDNFKAITAFMTKTSYVGGIIGYVNSSITSGVIIKDCANGAKVTARAKWFAVDGYAETYKFDATNKILFMYRYMDSNANAGGICANYISDSNISKSSSTNENVTRLFNFGIVTGNFKAWKPISVLNAQSVGSYNSVLKAAGLSGLGAGLVGAAGGMVLKMGFNAAAKAAGGLLVKTSLKTAVKAIPGVGWALLAVEVLGYIWQLVNYFKEVEKLKHVNVEYTLFDGNSDYTMTANTGSASTATNSDLTPSELDNALNTLGGNNYRSTFTGTTQTDAFGGVIKLEYIDTFKKATEDLVKYGPQASYAGGNQYIYYDDAKTTGGTTVKTLTGGSLSSLHYDQISPTLSSSAEWVNVYSDTQNYSGWKTGTENTATLQPKAIIDASADGIDYTNTEANRVLQFKELDSSANPSKKLKKYSGVSSTSIWGGSWDGEGSLITANPKPVEFDIVEENGISYYTITIENASVWRNLVYTINTGTLIDYDELGKIIEVSNPTKNPFLGTNVRITIDIKEGDKNIRVGSNVLNEFNGLLKVKSETKFTDMIVYTNNTTTSAGLIGYSDSATIDGLRITGTLTIDNEVTYDTMSYENFGIIIGTVGNGGAGVNITNSSTSIESVVYSQGAIEKMAAFGGIVGASLGNLTIANTKSVIIGEIIVLAGTIKDSATTDYYGFGGVVGKVSAGNVNIVGVNVEIKCLSLLSDINNVGGIIGYNGGNVTISNANVDLALFEAAATDTTRVGGMIGYNNNTLELSGSIGVNNGVTGSRISADVLDGKRSAYAGGIIGYATSNTYVLGSADIVIGQRGASSGTYQDVSYIVAGCNMYSDDIDLCAIPSTAKAGKIIGNINISEGELYNVVIKYASIDNTFDANNYTSKNTSTPAIAGFNVSGNTISFTNKGASFTAPEYVDNSITYTIANRTYYNSETTTNSVVYEQYLTYNYTDNSYSLVDYEIKYDDTGAPAGIVPGSEVYENLNYNFNVKYLIRISKDNSRVNYTNMYLLQVIVLNADEILNATEETRNIPGTAITPLILHSQRFSATENTSFVIEGLESLNLWAINVTSSIYVDNSSSDDTLTDRTITSTKTEFVISGGKIKLVETLSMSKRAYHISSTTNAINLDEELTTDITRTIFEQELQIDDYVYTSEVITDDLRAMVSGKSTFALGNAPITGEYNEDIVYNGFIIPYGEVKYNDKSVISANKYTKTVNNRNIEIISLVTGDGPYNPTTDKYVSYSVAEFVFKNDGGKLSYMGKMSYNLTSEVYDKIDFAKRYESYMPVLASDQKGIYDVHYELGMNLTDFTIPGLTVCKSDLVYKDYKVQVNYTAYRIGLVSGVLKVQSSMTETVETLTTHKGTLSTVSGDYNSLGCDEYYMCAGKVIGYKTGSQYFYYNYYNGAYSSVPNGTSTLEAYLCGVSQLV